MERFEKFTQLAARTDGFEAAIITSEANKYYLSGIRTPEAGTAVITKDCAYFIVDSRYIEVVENSVKTAKVILQGKLYSQIDEILKKHGVKTVRAENSLTLGEYSALEKTIGAKVVTDFPLTDILAQMRAVKDDAELALIKTAQEITEAGFDFICTRLAPGKKESDMALELEYFMRKNGADGLSFPTILISGAKTSMPHGVPSDKIIEKGDFVTMDYRAAYGGYCTDMTRTVAIGCVTDEMRRVYDTVLKAQTAALENAKPGMTGAQIDKLARDVIYGAGYEGYFGHSLGHSYGIEIHEKPYFSPNDASVIKEGMLITVEPGIYLPGKFGVRIEDTVRMCENGCENLTHSPKNLIIL